MWGGGFENTLGSTLTPPLASATASSLSVTTSSLLDQIVVVINIIITNITNQEYNSQDYPQS